MQQCFFDKKKKRLWFVLLTRTCQLFSILTKHNAQGEICHSSDCIYYPHPALWTLPFMCTCKVAHAPTHSPNHALTHADHIADAEAPYSQTVKWAGSVHLHSYGLHICLFFPEGAPPALGKQWKSCWWCSAESVSEGGGSGARPGISNRHAESRAGGPAPSSATAVRSTAEERGECWKHAVHQHAALKPHRYCFTYRHVSPLFSWRPATNL